MLELCRYDPAAFQTPILYRTNLNLRVAHILDSGWFCSRYLAIRGWSATLIKYVSRTVKTKALVRCTTTPLLLAR